MTLPLPRSIRAKLTLTTVLVIGLVLAAVGVVSDFSARETLFGSIDAELKGRVMTFAANVRPGPPPQPGMPQGQGPEEPGPFGQGPHFPGGPPGAPMAQPMRRFHLHTPPVLISVDPEIRIGPVPPEPLDSKLVEEGRLGRAKFSTIERDGEPHRVFSMPVVRDGRIIAVAQASYPLGDVLASLSHMRWINLVVVLPLGLVLAAWASLFVVNRLLLPLRRITHEAERIEGGTLEERLSVPGEDEFASLAGTLNGMLERIGRAFQLEKETTRKLEQTVEQQRRFTADASHELKTPLAVIKANAGLLIHSKGSAQERAESAEAIDAAASRMGRLVQDLLVLARADAGRTSTDVEAVEVRTVLEEAAQAVPGLEVRIDEEAPRAAVQGSRQDIECVFVNLFANAAEHADSKEPVRVSIEEGGSCVIVRVQDFGKGIAPEHLPRLFDRFYRTDASRSTKTGGTGMGLAICKAIVETHGGSIEASSTLGQGTAFEIRLPAA